MEFIVLTVFSNRLACSTEVPCIPVEGVGWDLTAQSQGPSPFDKVRVIVV